MAKKWQGTTLFEFKLTSCSFSKQTIAPKGKKARQSNIIGIDTSYVQRMWLIAEGGELQVIAESQEGQEEPECESFELNADSPSMNTALSMEYGQLLVFHVKPIRHFALAMSKIDSERHLLPAFEKMVKLSPKYATDADDQRKLKGTTLDVFAFSPLLASPLRRIRLFLFCHLCLISLSSVRLHTFLSIALVLVQRGLKQIMLFVFCCRPY